MSKVAVMGVIIGLILSSAACLYTAHTMNSLSTQLRSIGKTPVQPSAGLTAQMRESRDKELRKKYSEQLDSFAKVVRELQTEKDKGECHAP